MVGIEILDKVLAHEKVKICEQLTLKLLQISFKQ